MKHAGWLGRTVGLVMCLAMLAWAGWLWHARKTVTDYLAADALRDPVVPFCQWLPVAAPGIASIGLDTTSAPVWTYARHASMVFHTGSRQPQYVEVHMIMAVGRGISLSVDGGPAQSVSNESIDKDAVVRLRPARNTRDGLHVVRINVAKPRPPGGREQRWLGLAISGIRVCDNLSVPR